MTSIIDKLTDENWEKLAAQVAQEIFQKGTLVHGFNIGDYGIVTSISKTGKITVKRGTLSFEKVTDNENKGGTYGKFWYKADLKEFKPYTKEKLEFFSDSPITRYSPRCFYGTDWKKRGNKYPIEWYQIRNNRGYALVKPTITKKGLIMEESYSP